MQQARHHLNRILCRRTSDTGQTRTSKTPNTALHVAAGAHDISSVQKLLQSGLDARGGSSTTNTQQEAIHAALQAYGRAPERAARVIALLTLAGALDTSQKPFPAGTFPPRVAMLTKGAEDALGILLDVERERGHEEELRRAIDAEGLPKLCCETGKIAPLLSLLEANWDACTPDEHGATLVHHACNAPHLAESRVRAVVQVLIDYGNADLSLRDSFGRTVLQIARRRGMESVCELLRWYGADEEAYSTVLLRGVVDGAPTESVSSTGTSLTGGMDASEETDGLEGDMACVVCGECMDGDTDLYAECRHAFHSGSLKDWITQSSRCPERSTPLREARGTHP